MARTEVEFGGQGGCLSLQIWRLLADGRNFFACGGGPRSFAADCESHERVAAAPTALRPSPPPLPLLTTTSPTPTLLIPPLPRCRQLRTAAVLAAGPPLIVGNNHHRRRRTVLAATAAPPMPLSSPPIHHHCLCDAAACVSAVFGPARLLSAGRIVGCSSV